jgi:hypothetical protein
VSSTASKKSARAGERPAAKSGGIRIKIFALERRTIRRTALIPS